MLKTLHEKARIVFMLLLAVVILAVPAYAVINRIVGSNVTPGWGIQADGDSTEFNATQAWTDSLWEMVYLMLDTTDAPVPFSDSTDLITHDRIMVWHLGDDDWGDMSVATNAVTLDADVVGPDEMADGDHGDFTYATSVATLDADVVADNEIDYANVTFADFDYETAWRIWYSNTDGDVSELILGADGTYLRSNGASAAPTFTTPPGADPGAAIDDSLVNGYEIWHKIDTTTATIPVAEYADSAGLITDDAVDQWDLKTVNEPVDEDILTFESTTGDFEWHTPAELSLLVEYDQFWGGSDLAIKQGVGNDIAIQYPMSNDSNSYFVRHIHNAAADNKVDTVTWSGKLPMGIDASGVDSITHNMRTTGEAAASAIQLKVFKRDANELGALALCDSVAIAATTTGAWEHKTTGAMGVVSADAGDIIEIQFIVSLDIGELVEHDRPYVWYTGK